MYLDFFKLDKDPFHITPDPEFLFLTSSHKEAAASISYGIEQRKGFIAVTGEVGVGKTTILRSYLRMLDPDRNRVIYIFNTALTFEQLLRQIIMELGFKVSDADDHELVNNLFQILIRLYSRKQNVLLIIDEAQNLPISTLERLRMLSNLETAEDKLLQIVMVGQPEFDQMLEKPELRQLKQRIAVRARIAPLTSEESRAYIIHRLMRASTFFSPIFTDAALDVIISKASGIPRVVNILCDNALITAFGYQQNPVNPEVVLEVVADLNGNSKAVKPSIWRRIIGFFTRRRRAGRPMSLLDTAGPPMESRGIGHVPPMPGSDRPN